MRPTTSIHTLDIAQTQREDLCAALATSRRWQEIGRDETLWRPTVNALWWTWCRHEQLAEMMKEVAPQPLVPLERGYGQWGRMGRGGSRALLAYRGKCIAEPGLLQVSPRWPTRYWIKCVQK